MVADLMAKNSSSKWLFQIVIALTSFLALIGRLESAGRALSHADLFFYQGTDREQILLEGAKKEGQLVFYNSHTWFKSVAHEFEKKYPFIKDRSGAPTAQT